MPNRYHGSMFAASSLAARSSLLEDLHVLDGGMASELELLGAEISGPLWSAHVLELEPEKIVAVHRAYLEAGAEILLTSSYQVSRKGYLEFGLDPARADAALLHSVDLALNARSQFPGRKILVAASLGPYGAALHNGAEYHGNYDCTFGELVQFHQQRIAVLTESSCDLLAFETLPSLEEAQAIAEAIQPWPDIACWLSFNCPEVQASSLKIAHGEELKEAAKIAANIPQTVAVGINCTHPGWMQTLIPELRAATGKAIVVYPNSGEAWDASSRCWLQTPQSSEPATFAEQAKQWYAAGAQIVGGCCRTRPAHIQAIAKSRNQ